MKTMDNNKYSLDNYSTARKCFKRGVYFTLFEKNKISYVQLKKLIEKNRL